MNIGRPVVVALDVFVIGQTATADAPDRGPGRFKAYLCVCLLVTVAACSGTKQQDVDADLIISNVNVISMVTSSIDERRVVFVKDGVIVEIAAAGEHQIDSGTRVIDGTGMYLIPGLADMHVHVWASSELPLYVANGVTLVRNMWGEPPTMALRDRVESGEVLGPRIVTAGRLTDGDPPIWGEFSGVAGSPDEARAIMNEQQQAGYDFFKIYSLLTLETFDAISAYSKEIDFPFAGHVPGAVPLEHALRSGMSTIEHLTGWTNAGRHADSAFLTRRQEPDSGKRWANNTKVAEQLSAGEIGLADLFDLDETRRLAGVAADNDVWQVPTLSVNKRIVTSVRQAEAEFARPEMRFISPNTKSSWDPSTDFRLKDYSDEQLEASQVFFNWDLEVVSILHDAGAPLLAGTDAPNPFVLHGFAIHEELQFLVDAGLEPYEALVTATRAPAMFLGELEQAGTIEKGKQANLVLLKANPLEDISATREIVGVVLRGNWLPSVELNTVLEGIAASFELPDDWFAGVEFPDSGADLVNYDWTYDDTPSGAARASITASSDGEKILRIQARWRDGSDMQTANYAVTLDSRSGMSAIEYSVDGGGETIGASAAVENGVVRLFTGQAGANEASQEVGLPDDGLFLIVHDASIVALMPRLADLAVSESVELQVIVFEPFGLRLAAESWTVTRRPAADGLREFEGTSRRGSVETEFTFSSDSRGIVSFSLTNQFGSMFSTRRE